MYILPVSATPSKYTMTVVKYTPRRFGWEVVKLCNKIFELPPGTCKHLDAQYLEKVIRDKVSPMYRNLLNFELVGKRTKDGSGAGYYLLGNKFVRVGMPKPHTSVNYSNIAGVESEMTVYGSAGVLITTKIGEVELTWAMVSPRALIDISTFYKFAVTQTNWVSNVYISGNKKAYGLNIPLFSDSTERSDGNHLSYHNGKLTSVFKEYETVY